MKNLAPWPVFIPAIIVIAMASVGIFLHLGSDWRYVTDAATALSVVLVLWESLRQRRRITEQTAKKIGELLTLLRNAKADLSRAERSAIEEQLQNIQINLLKRASFHH
jgi:heme exporter protein D